MTDVASETAALLQRDAEFAAEASERRDVEKVVSYWSAEAVVMPPGQPPVVGSPRSSGLALPKSGR